VPLAEDGAGAGDVLTRRRCAIKLRSCGRWTAHSGALGLVRNRLAGSRQDPVTAEAKGLDSRCTEEQPDPMLVRVANGGSGAREVGSLCLQAAGGQFLL